MPTTVQSIIAFYALNKIGAVASFVHPLMGPDYLKEQIENVNSKGVMVLDLLVKALIAGISETLEKDFSKFYVPRDFIFMDELPQTPL